MTPFFFYLFKSLLVLSVSSVTLCAVPSTYWPERKKKSYYQNQSLCLKMTFYSPRLQHTDSWHHNSLCLSWKGCREKVSSYFTMETWQKSSLSRLFVCFFLPLLSLCLEKHGCFSFRARVLVLVQVLGWSQCPSFQSSLWTSCWSLLSAHKICRIRKILDSRSMSRWRF